MTIRADPRSVYGKKVFICSQGGDRLWLMVLHQGKEGVVVVRASSCTIVGHHPETIQTTNAATVVENLVDYINNPQ